MYFCPHFLKTDVQIILRFGILGEKFGKEVVSDLNIFALKWSFLFPLFIPFQHLFAPTSQRPMFKILKFLNPWGKIMERRGLRLNNFAHKGCKIIAHFSIFIFDNFFFVSVLISASVKRCLVSRMRDFFSIYKENKPNAQAEGADPTGCKSTNGQNSPISKFSTTAFYD